MTFYVLKKKSGILCLFLVKFFESSTISLKEFKKKIKFERKFTFSKKQKIPQPYITKF